MEVVQGGVYFYEPPGTSGSEQSGWRPYVIVSSDDVHRRIIGQSKATAVGVPLSKNIAKANSYRIQIPAAELIPQDPNRPFVDSVAMCDHVRVLDTNQIRAKSGYVSENALRSIGVGLAYVFDIR